MRRGAWLLVALALAAPAGAAEEAAGVPVAAEEGGELQAPAETEAPASPRARYNLALAQLEAGEAQAAADGFLAARDEAGTDAELRYRAAFNLGMALAAQADTEQAENPEEAIETLRSAAAWFNDAVRLAPAGDEDARINLELVLRRVQQLADQLNEGNRLAARLDRIIDDQRSLRDRIRRLLAAVEAEGAGAEPVGFQREFEDLATFERTLLAEAGSIGDLAAEERALIEEKSDEQRTQAEQVRAFQLESMNFYLQQSRQSLSDTRRRLRRLEAERAHRRADAALADLKRAREQLLDPVTVLKGIARDERSLQGHTAALEAIDSGTLHVDGAGAAPVAPPWLTSEQLGARQTDLTARTGEVLARLEAGTSEAAAEDGAEADAQRVIAAAREAIPFIGEARGAMEQAQAALAAGDLGAAYGGQADALKALYRAIERFAGVRDLIELAYADQTRIVELLTPPEDEEAMAQLSTAERSERVGEALASNRDRLQRLEGLLADERAEAEAGAAQGGDDASDGDAVGERFERAERLRASALAALDRLGGALAAVQRGEGAVDALEPATAARADLEELRRLFFSLVEHLRELLSDQGETHDRTATVQFESAVDRLAPELGLVAEQQGAHAGLGDSLAQALAEQADAAGASGDAQAQQSSGNLAEAAGEVRTAAGLMQGAAVVIAEASRQAASMSPYLEPALEDQLAAMERLENAIRLLQPPQQQDGEDQQQQQQQQQQQAQQPQQQDQQMSQRQALRRLQAIREREAERRQRREQAVAQSEPVEKDW